MYRSVINNQCKLLCLSAGLMCVELAAVSVGLCLLKPDDAPNVSTNWSHVSHSRRTRTVRPVPQIRPDCLHCYLQCSDSCINAEHICSSSSVFHFDWIRSLWGSVVWVRTSGLLQLVCVEFQPSCSTCSSLELIWTTEPSTSCCSGLHLCVWDVCVFPRVHCCETSNQRAADSLEEVLSYHRRHRNTAEAHG